MSGCWVFTKDHFPSRPKFYSGGSHKDLLVCSNLYGKGKKVHIQGPFWTSRGPHLPNALVTINLQPTRNRRHWVQSCLFSTDWLTRCDYFSSQNSKHTASPLKGSSFNSYFHSQGIARPHCSPPITAPKWTPIAQAPMKGKCLDAEDDLANLRGTSLRLFKCFFRNFKARVSLLAYRERCKDKVKVCITALVKGQRWQQKARADLGTELSSPRRNCTPYPRHLWDTSTQAPGWAEHPKGRPWSWVRFFTSHRWKCQYKNSTSLYLGRPDLCPWWGFVLSFHLLCSPLYTAVVMVDGIGYSFFIFLMSVKCSHPDPCIPQFSKLICEQLTELTMEVKLKILSHHLPCPFSTTCQELRHLREEQSDVYLHVPCSKKD